jgi:hypothetical protein
MDALKNLLPSLPAGASVFMVTITMPASSPDAEVQSAPPAPAMSRDEDVSLSETSGIRPGGNEEMPKPSLAQTPLERVRQERRERPNRLRKTAEWASLLGTSARALRRAVEAGALPYEAKPDGRDHGAIVIRPEVLEAFLATEETVRRGQCAPPEWWNRVFGRKAWANPA